MLTRLSLLLILAAVTVLPGCESTGTPAEENLEPEEYINAGDIEKHIKELSSDEYLGRKPVTEGETKTINYIKSEFEKLGLKPGNNGSYFQKVPLVEVTTTLPEKMTVTSSKGSFELDLYEEFVGTSIRLQENLSIKNSELVFCGFGATAPEYNWNDFEGVDVKGKTIIVLVNDPGFWTKDENLFKGNAMTYYGRWDYKFEEAARQGAEAIFVIHETEAAGYPYSVVQNSRSGAKLYLESPDGYQSRCALEGWITLDVAKQLFKKAGLEYETVFEAAKKPGFKAIPLGMSIDLDIRNSIKKSESNNVMAVYPGKERADEYIVYMGHWDHLGIVEPVDGDSICNGAVDNASGIACILEIAEAYTKLPEQASRSILFMGVTAEEQGLLGSQYYAENPVRPLEKTVAAINLDAMGHLGKMKDVTVVGYGQSDLDEYAEAAAKEQGRYILPNPTPQYGSYFRSDHFNFAKAGVPSMNVKGKSDHIEHGKDWVSEKSKEWTSNHYHRPSDEYNAATWDLSGMVQDAKLLFKIGHQLSNESTFPNWKEGSEFKAARDKMMEAM